MKKSILVIFLILCISVKSQDSELFAFSEVVQVENVSSEDLYVRAKAWFSENFKKTEYIIDIDDKSAGEIIGKGNFNYQSDYFIGSGSVNGLIHFTVKIFVKDGRYKYEITEFRHKAINGVSDFGLLTTSEDYPGPQKSAKKFYNNRWTEMKTKVTTKALSIAETIKERMAKPTESQNDDW